MLVFLDSIISTGNTILWSYVLIGMLLVLGIYFTFKTKFVQIKLLSETFKVLGQGRGSVEDEHGQKGISAFQAFCISVASHVGTGNLAGVAMAVSVGGPGAVFWMWLIALIGAATSFVENTLAQIYKVKDHNGYRGGPAYYMEKALGQKWMGLTFSVIITVVFGLVFNSVQANTISAAFETAFGINKLSVGIGLTALTCLVIFGGIKRIAKVAEMIVPVMATAYVLVALFVLVKNITLLPETFKLIFASAFGLKQAVGGGIGAAMMQGIKRGLFSNEAGMGSAPNAGATSTVSHPVKQGLLQMFGVFVDTIIICSATALVVLISGEYTTEGLTGIQLTQTALSSQVGAWGSTFIAACILLFAFSSIIGNYYYGESNIEFLNGNKTWLLIFRLSVAGMVFWGTQSAVSIVWNMADLFMGIMAVINLIAIAILGKIAFAALEDYIKQKKAGKDPVFHIDNIEGLKNVECWGTSKKSSLEKAI
ncbi:alanine/glycine:cation symporter family protein [Marinisporobacter balticus]|uniref:AGCS family alanine or glycine:cation symporter n=1 Tax=Marinisporobacter balticus TaxID=2018667 RepID=A0A4R2KU83_9FIRM|nr:alanine/glycine:cation symporter family protein [Marinisporobacter balticus]TCO77434.1 AGCS family alanine or glycine:cation symporter [Marinisporobacter balticus]